MTKSIWLIVLGFFVSLLGMFIYSDGTRSEYSHDPFSIFVGCVLIGLGGIIIFVHTIGIGVKVGNDMSKK